MSIVIVILIGIIISLIIGSVYVPLLKKYHFSQNVSRHLNERHLAKDGTPTMGGIIFILPPIVIILILLFLNKISLSYNLICLIIVFVLYALLGFIDDFIKIKFHNNSGLSILTKFTMQSLIAIIFFVFYLLSGNNTIITILDINIDLKFIYGIFIFLMLTGSANAVNITDGLDGLCAGLSLIAFFTYGLIAIHSSYIIGNKEIAIFIFSLTGSLLGFLFFNFYPAKVFMGDFGSLALGGLLAGVAIILKKELSLIMIGIVFILETLSSLLQIISIKMFNKKIFKKSPLHHHFEELGYSETSILKIFYIIGIFCSLVYFVLVH